MLWSRYRLVMQVFQHLGCPGMHAVHNWALIVAKEKKGGEGEGQILGIRADAVATSACHLQEGELGSYAELNRILDICILI